MINWNGEIIKGEELIIGANHRGLNYGDGLFETIRQFDRQLPYLKYHLQRLFKGMDVLNIQRPKHYQLRFFKKEIYKLIKSIPNARIRLTVFRSPGGLYTPTNYTPQFFITYQPLTTNNWTWQRKGLITKICPTIQLPINSLSGLKTINALPYILAGIYKNKYQLDDCILLNQNGQVAEGGSSNLFYIKNGILYTPDKNQGGIEGVMRRVILDIAKKNDWPIKARAITPEELLTADEVFLTNAISGIRWIKKIEQKVFKNQQTKQIFQLLKKTDNV